MVFINREGIGMFNSIVDDPLFTELQFNQKWVDLDLISTDTFNLISEEYSKGDDTRSEHYRWKTFKDFLKNKDLISRELFFLIYDLSISDPDYAMGRAMRFDLVKRPDCPLDLIEIAINDKDLTLSRHAQKCKSHRIKS
jgi:hypothetical protein